MLQTTSLMLRGCICTAQAIYRCCMAAAALLCSNSFAAGRRFLSINLALAGLGIVQSFDHLMARSPGHFRPEIRINLGSFFGRPPDNYHKQGSTVQTVGTITKLRGAGPGEVSPDTPGRHFPMTQASTAAVLLTPCGIGP